MISTIFAFISITLTIYSLLIFIRIIFSWFDLRNSGNGIPQNKITNFLYSITDPYLNWFRRFKFLQIGMMDFSAMLAIFVLYFISNITSRIALTGTISLIYLIKLILVSVWSLVSSLVTIFIIILAIRVIFLQLNKYSLIFQTMDGYLEPLVRRFKGSIIKKFTSYKFNLLFFIVSIFIIRYVLGFGINFLLSLF
ncbi:YggT family protein [Thiospirochaeta perfilievii]|uniref:YggT family protein n=1 Tax=Thiospirochaeta perfilievii TaxID=252967 RepID=A0A5C1QHS2_9SPIO|nr:YggT family protein [Thiospirochaeta perfilievii]QEN06094.1 YggT family protein [Thiospirochaeta perfilievii]